MVLIQETKMVSLSANLVHCTSFFMEETIVSKNFVIVRGEWVIERWVCWCINIYAPCAMDEQFQVRGNFGMYLPLSSVHGVLEVILTLCNLSRRGVDVLIFFETRMIHYKVVAFFSTDRGYPLLVAGRVGGCYVLGV
ncbi:hypothetical protein GQ457_17G013600 [Hibiscus cannabinus]